MEMFAPQLRAAVAVTRANDARRNDFTQAAKREHQRVVDATVAGKPAAARAAAGAHMERAFDRVTSAEQEFCAREGKEHALRLLQEQPFSWTWEKEL